MRSAKLQLTYIFSAGIVISMSASPALYAQSWGTCGYNLCASSGANVGIGTTSAPDTLTVNGNFSVSNGGSATLSFTPWIADGTNYIESGNAAWTASTPMFIGGYNATQMPSLYISSANTTHNGNFTVEQTMTAAGMVTSGSDGNETVRFTGIFGQNYIESSNSAFTASAPLNITGLYSGQLTALNIDSAITYINGNVGIGTSDPCSNSLAPSNCKLSVAGAVQAQEVVVNTGWSDYVFDQGYRLTSLEDVAQFVKTNHHLPGIPPAAEVAAQGVSLGEMQSKLLAKIEELTLHLIEEHRSNQALREDNRILSERIDRLEEGRSR